MQQKKLSDKKGLIIAAVSDLHMQPNLIGSYRNLFIEISQEADVLLLCGDLTDHGVVEEAEMLKDELSFCKVPILGVLGNHDYADNRQEEIKKSLSQTMHFLENQPFVIQNVGFAGAKGFGGGFDNHIAGGFGEDILKRFVYEAINETLILESALRELDTSKKVVVLHYSPTRQTLAGEPEEIYPFLGSSRLAEPIDNFNVTIAFHGHAHYGSPEGKTAKGTPVYNVVFSLRQKLNKNKPYLLVEI